MGPTNDKDGVVFGFGKLGNEFDILQDNGAAKGGQMGGNFYDHWDEDEDDLFGVPSD